MKFVRKYWKPVALIAATLGMLVVIVQSVLAGAQVADPLPADETVAARVIPPPEGTTDLRVQRPEGEWLGGLGIIEPAQPESRLVPAVAGRISRIAVEEGQHVEAGALLVELESAAEQAALAAAEAEVGVAQAELSRTRRGLRPEERLALERDTGAAEARAELSEGVLERLQRAAAGGGVSVDQVARAERQALVDRRTAEGAAARERASRRGRGEDVRLAQARLLAAEARRDQALANLSLRQIVAPVAGEVLEIHYRLGEYVSPSGAEPLVILGDTSELRARIDIDERDVARLAPGARALVTVDALPNVRFEGAIVEIGRRMGRKNVRTDEPTERLDTKILEVVVALRHADRLIVGQRVMGYVAPGAESR